MKKIKYLFRSTNSVYCDNFDSHKSIGRNIVQTNSAYHFQFFEFDVENSVPP